MNGNVKSSSYFKKLYNCLVIPFRNLSVIWQVILVYFVILTCLFTFLILMHYFYYKDLMLNQNDNVYYQQIMRKILLNQSDQFIEYYKSNIVEQTQIPIKHIFFNKILFKEFIGNGLVSSNTSTLTNFTLNFVTKIRRGIRRNERNNIYEILESDIPYFNDDPIYHFNSSSKEYYFGDLTKLYYIFYPLIARNFIYNDLNISSGFFTVYPLETSKIPSYISTNFKDAPKKVTYFQYPVNVANSIVYPMINFNPLDYYTDPVPYLLSFNVDNFVVNNNWMTPSEKQYLFDQKRNGIYRTAVMTKTNTNLDRDEKSIGYYITSGNLNDIKIFFSFGYKINKYYVNGHNYVNSEFFGVYNLYGESNSSNYLQNIYSSDNTFQYNISSVPLQINNREYLQYYSFDTSSSILFKTPTQFSKMYDYSLYPRSFNKSFSKFNINPQDIKELSFYVKNFSFNPFFKNDLLFYFFIYYTNVFLFLRHANLQLNKENPFSSAFTETCNNVNLTEYSMLLKNTSYYDCMSDDSMNNMDSFQTTSANYYEYKGKLINCYCIGLLCLDTSKPNFKEVFYSNITSLKKSEEDFKKMNIPTQCAINLNTMYSEPSGGNLYRVIPRIDPISMFNFSDIVLIFLNDDYDFNEVLNIYNNKSFDLVNYIFYAYLGSLLLMLIFFVILARKKTGVLKDKLVYLSNVYLEMVHRKGDLSKGKKNHLSKKDLKSINSDLNNKEDPVIKSLRHLEGDESRLIITSPEKKDLKKKQSIFDFKLPNKIRNSSRAIKSNIQEAFDEIDDIYNILKDNLDIFRIEFNLENTYNLSGRFLKTLTNRYTKNRKLVYLFQNDEEFLRRSYGTNFYTMLAIDELKLSKKIIQEISNVNVFIEQKFTRNFLFKFCKYDENDTNLLFKRISSFKKELSKIYLNTNSSRSEHIMENDLEFFMEKLSLYHQIDHLIELNLADINNINFNDVIMQKENLISFMNHYLENIFYPWLNKANE